MEDFLLWSLIASVALTTLFNLLLIVFPTAMDRMEHRIAQALIQNRLDNDGQLQFVFPVRVITVGSLILTVLVNICLMLGR